MKSFLTALLCILGGFVCSLPVNAAENTVIWKEDKVQAEIKDLPLKEVLEKIAKASGWKIYYEPNPQLRISTRFKDRKPGEALDLLLGRMNFAIIAGADQKTKLFVYRSHRDAATNLVLDENGKRIPNELILSLKKGSKADVDALAASLGGKVTGRIPELGAFRVEFSSENIDSLKQSLENNPEIDAADYNYSIDRPDSLQLASSSPSLPFSLKPSVQTDGSLVIGLIDTAVQWDRLAHPDFFLPPLSVAGQASFSGEQPSHGTSMAETMLNALNSTLEGNQSAVRILPVDVYGSNPTTSSFDVAYGVSTAIKNGATIINMSLGSPGSSTFLENLINNSVAQGVVFFAAAGNEPTQTPVYPAAYSQVVAVTAADRSGQLASYANRGEFVDILSPGTSLVPYGARTWVVTGTSAASAFAAGAAAAISESTKRPPGEVEKAMRSKMGFKATRSF